MKVLSHRGTQWVKDLNKDITAVWKAPSSL